MIRRYPDADIIAFNFASRQTGQEHEDNVALPADRTLTGLEQMKTYNLYLWNKIFKRSVIGEYPFCRRHCQSRGYVLLSASAREDALGAKGLINSAISMTARAIPLPPVAPALRHYVKNYQDSVLIQGSIKRMAEGYD